MHGAARVELAKARDRLLAAQCETARLLQEISLMGYIQPVRDAAVLLRVAFAAERAAREHLDKLERQL